jgi:IS30 family transposase
MRRPILEAGIDVCSCDPKSPRQRPVDGSTNGLIRQCLPEKADLAVYSQEELDAIALKLNTRPRKTLGFVTPAAKLEEVLR